MSITDVRVQVPPRAPRSTGGLPSGGTPQRGSDGSKSSYDARVVELADSLDSGSSVHYGRAGSSPASRTKTKGHPFGCPFVLVSAVQRAAPPFGIAMLGGSTRKGYATSVRRQGRQRLCGELRLRQNTRTAHWRRRPESRSGGSSIPFRDFKISILTVPSSSSQASYRLLRLFSFPHRSHLYWVAMCVRRYAAAFSYRKEISILTVLSKWRLHEASPADWGCRPLSPSCRP